MQALLSTRRAGSCLKVPQYGSRSNTGKPVTQVGGGMCKVRPCADGLRLSSQPRFYCRSHADSGRCLIPRFDGAILSKEWKEALWDKFVTGAPRLRPTASMPTYFRPPLVAWTAVDGGFRKASNRAFTTE